MKMSVVALVWSSGVDDTCQARGDGLLGDGTRSIWKELLAATVRELRDARLHDARRTAATVLLLLASQSAPTTGDGQGTGRVTPDNTTVCAAGLTRPASLAAWCERGSPGSPLIFDISSLPSGPGH